MKKILVLSDTHAVNLAALPKALVEDISGADIVVHCGDYTGLELLQELKDASKRFVGVYGNMDVLDIRKEVPRKTTFEVEGKKIGVIHPYWGGDAAGIQGRISKEFHGVDLILYGHTHDAGYETIDGICFLNPGQSHSKSDAKITAGVITVGPETLEVEIKSF
jgi:putative phosphoesterase